MSNKIDERIFIELYKTGKSSMELAKIFGYAQRTIERYEEQLRVKNKIGYRKALASKTISRPTSKFGDIPSLDWKIAKTDIGKNPKNVFKKYLIIGDTHVPYVNVPSIKSILMMMEDVKFDGFIALGDIMDMSPISHWLKNKKKTLENKRMLTDYAEGNKLLDEFDSRLPKGCDKRFFYGNHEDWYYQLIEEYPALEGLLEPATELKLKERGYIVYDEINHIEKIGRLAFTHGIYHAQNFVKKHIDELKTNVLFAHLHTPRERFACSPAKEIAIAGYCIGCLCDLSPDYMKNRPNSWVHGFGVVYFYDDGYFDVHLGRIVKGKFIFNDKMYDGNGG